jgi:hypothetical protein
MACAIVPPALKAFEQNDLLSIRSKPSIDDLLSLTQTSAPFVFFDRLINLKAIACDATDRLDKLRRFQSVKHAYTL